MHNYAVISFFSVISFLESQAVQRCRRFAYSERDPTKAAESWSMSSTRSSSSRYLEIPRVICSPLISPRTRSYVLNNSTVRISFATGLLIPSEGAFFAEDSQSGEEDAWRTPASSVRVLRSQPIVRWNEKAKKQKRYRWKGSFACKSK